MTHPTDAAIAQAFRKKPVVIEAMRFDGTVASANAIRAWATKPDGMSAECGRSSKGDSCYHFRIETLEGAMTADAGDWVIKGIKGEFYPCKPDIFAATYEDAATPPAQAAEAVAIAGKLQEARLRIKALEKALALVPANLACDSFHHSTGDRHGALEQCPVAARYETARAAIAAMRAGE